MADRKQLLKRFVLEWKIRNYSYCVEYTKGLKSSAFQLLRPRSSWQLEIKVGDKHEIQVCLCRQFMTDGPSEINVRFLLCLKTLHGTGIWRFDSRWLLFKKESTFVSVPLSLETNHTTVVTCVMLIMDQPGHTDPNVEFLYRDIRCSNDRWRQKTNVMLLVGELEKRMKVNKEMPSSHSTVFAEFYRHRHNDEEYAILGYSSEVIESILTLLYSGDFNLLENDKNISELLSCASELAFFRLIGTLRSESLIATSEFKLEDIIHKWNFKNFNGTLGASYLTDSTALRIVPLHELRCCMAFQSVMHVDMTSGHTLFSIEVRPLAAESLSTILFMKMSVLDNDDCIHLKSEKVMDPDSGGIYRLQTSIENNVLFGTDKASFPRHVNFNYKIVATLTNLSSY